MATSSPSPTAIATRVTKGSWNPPPLKCPCLKELRRVVLEESRHDLLNMNPKKVHESLSFLRDSNFSPIWKYSKNHTSTERANYNYYTPMPSNLLPQKAGSWHQEVAIDDDVE
jgi:hypothetical protein